MVHLLLHWAGEVFKMSDVDPVKIHSWGRLVATIVGITLAATGVITRSEAQDSAHATAIQAIEKRAEETQDSNVVVHAQLALSLETITGILNRQLEQQEDEQLVQKTRANLIGDDCKKATYRAKEATKCQVNDEILKLISARKDAASGR